MGSFRLTGGLLEEAGIGCLLELQGLVSRCCTVLGTEGVDGSIRTLDKGVVTDGWLLLTMV